MATADQTVSAVLEATNKAYIVETGDSEDGLSHYRRWSNGTIEQWGECVVNKRYEARTLFIPFTSANYRIFISYKNSPSTYPSFQGVYGLTANPLTESTFECGTYGIDGIVCCWYAIGK